ncbi:hypothetical protein BZB76_1818 [Actinomadura pelletieri DSM 43383]|uniref:DUF8094 domain-containing protein n=1 Tax=Actinomadura pelletieri DSM 43383 TaxID=1120940 RepID=A0A495QSN4_9ACTN|nr:hypothetical protein [Actinomadura pelletieri]RKS76463.1 hypothetical protein BZB76_1818 [Actinomadura pelletieri DSM 43383]
MPARTVAVASLSTFCLLSGALTAACSGATSSAGAERPGKPARPALAKTEAQRVLLSYTDAANRAGRHFNGKALRTVETDPQLSMDDASLRLRRIIKRRPPKLRFTNTAFYIPRLRSHPHWFAVGAVSGKGKHMTRHAMLFTQAKPGAPWLLTADPYLADDTLSRVALDPNGFATPVRPETTKGLAVAPRKVPDAHAALLTTGPGAAGTSVLADGLQTTETYKALKRGEKTLAGRGVTLSSRFSSAQYSVYALRTKDRGAVVWYVLKQHEAYSATKPGVLTVGGDLLGLAPAKVARTRMDTTVLVQYLATVPPKGRTTVTGIYRKAVTAHGS